MKTFLKILKVIVGLAIVGVLVFVFRGQLQNLLARFKTTFLPCQQSITYQIGSFDPKFGISQDYFLSALREAEAIWEQPIDRALFTYEPTAGNLKVNLIYDYRQEATAKLQKLGLSVNEDQASYNALKVKYDALNKTYLADKTAYEAKLADYKTHQATYEKAVADWNAGPGDSPGQYNKLNVERNALNAEVDELNQLQASLKDEVDTINSLVVVLNRAGSSLNLGVDKYNTVGGSLGSEFEEGNYQSGPDGQQIDIYEFNNRGKLVRVLAHELGHALGLDHVDDPKAIMYRLNNGVNSKLTAADLTDLEKLCNLPAPAEIK